MEQSQNKKTARNPDGLYKPGDTKTSIAKNGFVKTYYLNGGEWFRVDGDVLKEIDYNEKSRLAKKFNNKVIVKHIRSLVFWRRRIHSDFKRALKNSIKRIKTENKHYVGRRKHLIVKKDNVGKHKNKVLEEGRVRMSKIMLFLIERVISEYPKSKGIIKDYLLTNKSLSNIARDNETSESVVSAICKIITPKLEDLCSNTIDKS